MFAVYDGHGGAEVATYCSQNLPNFIKNTEAYKNGDMVKALTDAFLGFDAAIATKEVMDILKELAGKFLLHVSILYSLKCDLKSYSLLFYEQVKLTHPDQVTMRNQMMKVSVICVKMLHFLCR